MSFDHQQQQARNNRDQAQAWKTFLAELDNLQTEYRATKTEIIDGLKVTRSKFYDFEKHPEKGLNINRSSILNLWAYLSDTENRKKIPKTAEEQRKKLRENGPDQLLIALGFATQSQSGTEVWTEIDPQIRRVMHRLASKWIYDDAVRVYITNKILDQILDLGQPESTAHMETVKLREVETWPETSFLESKDARVNEKYRRAVQMLVRSGKTTFVRSELFELYQSIFEHNELGLGGDAYLSIVDCQFRALSQDLSELANDALQSENSADPKTEITKKHRRYLEDIDFEDTSKRAEKRLIKLLVSNDSGYYERTSFEEPSTDIDIVSTPCLEARIRYQVKMKEQTKTVAIQYSSTSTHVENMLRAMSRGLGYPLGVSGFSIRATGRTEKSLARISIALSKLNEDTSATPSSHAEQRKIDGVYEGWWVTSNTIIGILSATADAVTRWIHKENIEAEAYYEACVQSAELSQQFYDLRKALYEYTPHAVSTKKERFETNVRNLIEDTRDYIERYDRYQEDDGFKIHLRKMKDQKIMSFLALAHSTLVAGKPLEAEKILYEELGSNLEETERNQYSYVLSVYGEACKMSHKLLSGDESFLIGKQWKYEKYSLVDRSLEKLGRYIRDVKNIDFDVYLVISQLFGIIGILDFYSSPDPSATDISSYTESTDFLIEAAHYSLRIGHSRRASQWLSFASRMCARLGSREKADELYHLAVHISGGVNSLAIDKLFQLQYSDLKSNWSGVNHLLARGEICLLENNNNDALDSFLNALDIALRVGYGRVIPDCLYDIARASEPLAEKGNTQAFQGFNPFEKWTEDNLKTWREGFDNLGIANTISSILARCLMGKTSKKIELSNLASESRSGAADIWNSWRKNEKNHPYAEQIMQGSF